MIFITLVFLVVNDLPHLSEREVSFELLRNCSKGARSIGLTTYKRENAPKDGSLCLGYRAISIQKGERSTMNSAMWSTVSVIVPSPCTRVHSQIEGNPEEFQYLRAFINQSHDRCLYGCWSTPWRDQDIAARLDELMTVAARK